MKSAKGLHFLNRWLCISAAILLASATLCEGFSGGLYPVFEMERCVGDAKLVVRGLLDEKGNIQAQETFKGEQPTNILAVADGAKIYQTFLASMKGAAATSPNAIEVVAFLGEQIAKGVLQSGAWQPVSGYAGMACLENTNVYLFGFGRGFGGFDSFPQPNAHRDEHFTRDSFLAAVKEQVKVCSERDALLAMPKSAERAQKLIAFLLEHGGGYDRWRISGALRPINPDEQKEILNEIAGTTDISTKCFLIGLAGDIPLSKDAFDTISPLIDARNPPQLRRAAMFAVARINPPKATERVLPLVHVTEPELDQALASLGTPPTDVPPDLNVVNALLLLSKEIRRQDAKGEPPISGEAQRALGQELAQYVHPKLIAFYFNWPLDRKPRSPDYVTSYLQAMLGVRWSSEQLEAWWKQQRKIIEAVYDLQKSHDRKRWFDAYQDADDVSKHFLVRLWIFTPATNQLALVKAATEQKTAVAAKTIITELWNNHLSNEAKQAMFENFVKVDFVDEAKTFSSRFKNQHELVTTLKFDYPFNTCIYYRTPIALDGKIFEPTTSQNQICLEPKLKEYRIGSTGGYVPGKVATGTLEIFQRDHYPDGKELWHAQWQLGPVPLGERFFPHGVSVRIF